MITKPKSCCSCHYSSQNSMLFEITSKGQCRIFVSPYSKTLFNPQNHVILLLEITALSLNKKRKFLQDHLLFVLSAALTTWRAHAISSFLADLRHPRDLINSNVLFTASHNFYQALILNI